MTSASSSNKTALIVALVAVGALVLVAITAAVVVVGLGIFAAGQSRSAGPRTIGLYFYDLDTGQLFEASSDQIPPIDAPSGPLPNGQPAGVKAFVFSCTDCSNPASRQVGWLETYTPEAKAALVGPVAAGNEMDYYEIVEKGQLIKTPGGSKWVPMNSEAGYRLTEKVQSQLCPGGTMKACYP